jgi:hypothetical protein
MLDSLIVYHVRDEPLSFALSTYSARQTEMLDVLYHQLLSRREHLLDAFGMQGSEFTNKPVYPSHRTNR